MKINCPNCLKPTQLMELEPGLHLDRCPICKGFWVDDGELESAFGSSENLPDLRHHLHAAEKVALQCPKCPSENLFRVPFYLDDPDVKVDFCQNCQGIWMDVNELGGARNLVKKKRIAARKRP